MSLFFYLFTIVINLWQQKFVTADVAVFVKNNNYNMVFSDEDQILIKRLYLKRYTAKRLTGEFPEKNWTKHGVDKLLKNCGTQAQLTEPPNATPQQPALFRATHILPKKITISLNA